MTRHFSLAAFLSCVFGVLATSQPVKADLLSDSMWWHNQLSQQSRNFYIANMALTYWDGYPAGQSCKVWANNVVLRASRGTTSLPLNDPYCDWRWLPSGNVRVVATDMWFLFSPGQIMQAQVRAANGGTSLHTMIITAASPFTVTVADCNYKGDGVVHRRTYLWPDFQRFVLHFTIYEVK